MYIKQIHVSNFRSFKDVEIKFRNLNVIIGSNASGKSNFIQIFKFLHDLLHYDLENAISMQGGIKYLRNLNIGSSKRTKFEILIGNDEKIDYKKETEEIKIAIHEIKYKFALDFSNPNSEYEIIEDHIKLELIFETERKDKTYKGFIEILKGQNTINTIVNIPNELNLDPDMILLNLSPLAFIIKRQQASSEFKKPTNEVLDKIYKNRNLLIQEPGLLPYLTNLFERIEIYDFDPKLSKMSIPITGMAYLDNDGGNLAIVLKKILKDEDKKRKFTNLISEFLPFVTDIETEMFVDSSYYFKIREQYSKDQFLPASMISDGTINIISIIVALYFEDNSATVIEEPGRNLHPHLISKVMGILKEASQEQQVIITTHNPELLNHCDLESILLISRDQNGYSKISSPGEKETVKTFLKNEIGISELFIQKLLE